jgi:TPR repeat protein
MMPTMRCLRRGLLAGLVCLFAVAGGRAQAQDFGSGLSAYYSGGYLEAMRIWRPLADKGDARAQAGIGYMFLRGLGTDVDTDLAKGWYEKAAAQGQAEAQLMLGLMYFYGQGVTRNFIWAYAWCQMAYINGNPDAFACRDASIESMTDSAQMTESFRLAQQLLKQQEAAKR